MTSARTGYNVQESFEEITRMVLRKKGHIEDDAQSDLTQSPETRRLSRMERRRKSSG